MVVELIVIILKNDKLELTPKFHKHAKLSKLHKKQVKCKISNNHFV